MPTAKKTKAKKEIITQNNPLDPALETSSTPVQEVSNTQAETVKQDNEVVNVPEKKKTILVDFDGPIHAYSKGWQDGTIYDEPTKGAKEALAKLCNEYRVIIFTTRLNPDPFGEVELDIKDSPLAGEKRKEFARIIGEKTLQLNEWLHKHGFIHGVHYHGMTFRKIAAQTIIDDRVVRFTDWDNFTGVKQVKEDIENTVEANIDLGTQPSNALGIVGNINF